MFKNLFKKNEPKKYGPIEPIYPGESFEVAEISDDNGFFGFSSVNKAYDNYPNKKYFPWWIQVTLELKDVNEKQMPSESESKLLEELENKIEAFISEKHKTHFIGRVTHGGLRDLIFFVNEPRFDQEETSKFFDHIQTIRSVNFEMDKDLEWNNIGGLIK